MVIILDDDGTHKRPPPRPAPEPSQSSTTHEIPEDASECTPLLPPPAYTPRAAPDDRAKPPNASTRFWKALAIGVCIVLVLSELLEGGIVLHGIKNRAPESGRTPALPQQPQIGPPEWPDGEDGRAEYCLPMADWNRTGGVLRHHFDLPYAALSAFVTSRKGAGFWGSLDVRASPDTPPDSIRVSLSAIQGDMSNSSACLLRRGSGDHGVGIVNISPGGPTVQLHIDVAFPYAHFPPPLVNFSAHLPGFAQRVAPTGLDAGYLSFARLALFSARAPLVVDGTTAVDAELETSDAPLTGMIVVLRSAMFVTRDESIDMEVYLHNAERQYYTTSANISTTNADMNVTLRCMSSPYHRGLFAASLVTTRGALTVDVRDLPAESHRLRLRASTSAGTADVRVPPAYVGGFLVFAGPNMPNVSIADDVPRAAQVRQGRMRALPLGRVFGDVRWLPEDPRDTDDDRGMITLDGPRSEVTLVV